jgi:hypothetical protein
VEFAAGNYGTRRLNIAANHGSGLASYNLIANGVHSGGYRDNNVLNQQNIQLEASLEQSQGELFLKLGADNQDLGLPGERTVDPGIGLDE